MTRVMTMLAAVVVVVLAAGAPAASALDLTGNGEGKATCKGLAFGEKVTFTCCETLEITQSGATVNIRLPESSDLWPRPSAASWAPAAARASGR